MSRPAAPARVRRRGRSGGAPADIVGGIVAIVGRPNVGKSTLFNRLTGRRQAIVDPQSGLTRDRIYGLAEWRGRGFTVIDTAGLDGGPSRDAAGPEGRGARTGGGESDAAGLDELARGTQEQARAAIAEADLCLLLVDVRDGVTAVDEEIADRLRQGGRAVILVGNKADSAVDPYLAHELYRLGLGEPTLISALQGKDTGDLLDRVVDALPPAGAGEPAADETRIAIVGRPNVGKSSLLNALVGGERALVSPVPGTTRDAVDTVVMRHGERIRLVDTAGIRRRALVSSTVEHYSVLRALRALERSDAAILVVDAAAGVMARDRHVASHAVETGKALVVVANKWDLVDAGTRADPAFLQEVRAAFAFAPGAPVVTASAVEGRNVGRVLDAARGAVRARATRIPTPALNTLLRQAMDERPPAQRRGRRLKLLFAAQASSPTPTIVLFVNDPELLDRSYARYLENRVRAVFGFAGVRLRMVARRRAEA